MKLSESGKFSIPKSKILFIIFGEISESEKFSVSFRMKSQNLRIVRYLVFLTSKSMTSQKANADKTKTIP